MESNGIVINRIETSAKKRAEEKRRKKKGHWKRERKEEVSELQMGDLLCRYLRLPRTIG